MLKLMSAVWTFLWRLLTGVRTTFFNLIFLALVVAIIASIKNTPDTTIPKKTALLISPSGNLVDQRTHNPTPADLLLSNDDRADEIPLRELTQTIRKAAKDKRITSIIFQLDYFNGGGISKMEELGQAIDYFKESGKPVYAYADNYSQQQYFLASYADKIYMNDMGNLLLTGFGVYHNYYKNLADKLSLKFHVFRVGDYKDAVEPFMRDSMSDKSREHNGRWINQLWQRYTAKVALNRNSDISLVPNYIEQIGSTSPTSKEPLSTIALNAGLIDKIGSRNDIDLALAKLVGKEDDSEHFKAINYDRYRNATVEMPNNKQAIGLILATGTILDGYQDASKIGGDSLIELIRTAEQDDSIKALIIRVDSGGGSAFASEMIRDEIVSARNNGLPIYISMGSIAASGGYWISTPAKEIWATPATLTGSIGVWALIPNLAESTERIGINTDGVGTTELADIYNIERPMSENAKQLIQSGVNDIYSRFLTIVADARDSDPASVNEIAGGRVWTGEMAKSLGLVDNLGTLDDLIIAVAQNENLSDYQVKNIEKPLSTSEKVMRELMKEVSVQVDYGFLSGEQENLTMLRTLNSLNSKTSLFGSLSQMLKELNITLQEGKQPGVVASCMECYAP